jgi:hypothetical protein
LILIGFLNVSLQHPKAAVAAERLHFL